MAFIIKTEKTEIPTKLIVKLRPFNFLIHVTFDSVALNFSWSLYLKVSVIPFKVFYLGDFVFIGFLFWFFDFDFDFAFSITVDVEESYWSQVVDPVWSIYDSWLELG